MKTTIILLALIGLSYSGAEAQTKSPEAGKICKCHSSAKMVKAKKGVPAHRHVASTTTKTGETYQVCREEGGHYTCCKHHKTVVTTEVK